MAAPASPGSASATRSSYAASTSSALTVAAPSFPTSTPAATGIAHKEVVDWTDLGKEMWSYLTGKGAAIDYTFVDMSVEVPRDTGAEAPRATWKLNGTLRITTTDRDSA